MRRVLPFGLLLYCTALQAQQIARDAYRELLPPMPKLVSQTRASVAFTLYGDRHDSSYLDANLNGIDDRREQVLHDIADQFSPILHRNNFSIPLDFKRVLGDAAVIEVDTWNSGKLVRSEKVPLFGAGFKSSTSDASNGGSILQALVLDHLPSERESRYTEPEDFTERVLFLDFPGTEPKSWREVYKNTRPEDATSYVHFYLYADTAASGSESYFLIAQYWFFYPFNDAANNHEGDWERINVGITTDAAVTRERAGLTREEVKEVLSGRVSREHLRIAFVDYFFHESAITLDYLPMYRPAAAMTGLLQRFSVWRDTAFVNRTLRQRVSVASGALATHPIGFIGGNNKGPDELLAFWPRFRRSYNRNSHGTYPFPGIWQSVGPLGSTEHISGRPTPEVGAEPLSKQDLADKLAAGGFVPFRKENLVLVPDWECIEPLLRTSGDAQQNWSWLVLPIRWGYPATESPGAGALKHVDLGNIAPEGPAFQPGWNRVGTAGWRSYDPDVLQVMLTPTSPFDKMTSGWGFLNLPAALLGSLPGWNVVGSHVMPWLTGSLRLFNATLPRTFTPRDEPRRYTSLTAGPFRQTGGNDFAFLLHDAQLAVMKDRRQSTSTSTTALAKSASEGVRVGIALHYGEKVSIENTFSINESVIGAQWQHEETGPMDNVNADIKIHDLTGGFRYSVVRSKQGSWHGFLKAGYGWAWYDISNLHVNGQPEDYTQRSGYAVTLLPSKKWWPNSWYGGMGVEYFAPRRGWLLQQFGYGIRAEFTALQHRLGARSPGAADQGMTQRNDLSIYGVIGW